MGDPADNNNAFLEIHAGAGGTESQDWAEMLQRMYIRWAEKNNSKVSLLQESKGEEAGIKSSTLKITGENVIPPKLLLFVMMNWYIFQKK